MIFNQIALLIITFSFSQCSEEKDVEGLFTLPSADDVEVSKTALKNAREAIQEGKVPIDLVRIYDLETFGCGPEDTVLGNRFVLLVYFSEIHCETCFEESIANIRILKRDLGDRLDFCFVANLEQDRRRQWLKSMMRTSVISCPVFLDPDGASSLPAKFCFYLVDMKDSMAVLRYSPQKGSPQTWGEFREITRELIKK